MVAIADFQVPDTVAAVYEYAERPSRVYSGVEHCPDREGITQRMLKEGKIDPKGLQAQRLGMEASTLKNRSLESKYCPEGILGQTLSAGDTQRVTTTQDDLEMPYRTSAEWFRSREPFTSAAQQCAYLAYVMDGPTSWLPLLHEQKSVGDFAAVASLEFALRFFTSELRCEEWHMKEVKSTAAGECRTFHEGKVWDESGKLVCSMTQQDIARPKVGATKL